MQVSMDIKIYTDTVTILDETTTVDLAITSSLPTSTFPIGPFTKELLGRTFKDVAQKVIDDAVASSS